MSTNRRKLKRNIRPPKRYEDSVSTLSKRKGIEVESSSDEISKEDFSNAGKEHNPEDLATLERVSLLDYELPKAERSVENKGKNQSYANMVKNNDVLVNKKLLFIAPKVTEDGMVKVLFNEEIVSKGCAKWKYTICGQFIGQNMSYFEMRYHARRMWGRYGLTEVIVNSSGVNLFKDEKGMNCVLEQGP
ncbi:hypothetical protein Tco_0246061 [Tanacetum coccineum]